MSHHENPGAAGTSAGTGGTQSEPDAYALDSKNVQLTKARTVAKGGLPVSPCKPEIFGDKPKQPFTDQNFEHATTYPQKADELWLDTRTCRSTSEQLGTAGSRS